MWTEEQLREYYTKKGFSGQGLEDMVKKHIDPNTNSVYTSEDTDSWGATTQAQIDKNDQKVLNHRKYLRDRSLYNTKYLGGIGVGVARQLPLIDLVTDVTDAFGLTDQAGVGDSETLNNLGEASIGSYLGSGMKKVFRGMNPIEKNKNPFEKILSKGQLKNVGNIQKATRVAGKVAKGFGMTDRITDGLQLIDHVKGYNPPKESDYYERGGKFNYLK